MRSFYIILSVIIAPISIAAVLYILPFAVFKYIGIGYQHVEEKSFDCVKSDGDKLLEIMRDLSKQEKEQFILKEYIGFSDDLTQFNRRQFGFCHYGGCFELQNIYHPNVYRFSYIKNGISFPPFRKKFNIDFKKTLQCEKYGAYGTLG